MLPSYNARKYPLIDWAIRESITSTFFSITNMLKSSKRFITHLIYPDCSGHLSLDVTAENGSDESVSHALTATMDKRLAAGFYMLECVIAGESLTGEARFLFRQRGSKDDIQAFLLPFNTGKLTKRVIFFSTSVNRLRIKLGTQSGSLSAIEQLRFVPLRKTFARQLMLKRLRSYLGEEAVTSKESAKGVFSAYDQLFLSWGNDRYPLWIERLEAVLLKAASVYAEDPGGNDDYCLVVNKGYKLAPQAKAILRQRLEEHPEAVLVYPDEDWIDELGQRSRPHFKPDWNPDLFFSKDYISGCYLCRKSWLQHYHSVFERYGSELALSWLLPTMRPEQILHIPLVLAHRKTYDADDSEFGEEGAKSENISPELRKKVFKELLGEGCTIESGLVNGTLRIRYSVPQPSPLVSLLIPTRDGLEILKPCVYSILEKSDYQYFEILILDNQSVHAETLLWFEEISQDERVRVLKYDHPFNYSAINNFGAKHARGTIIGLINNDVEVIASGWLTEMVSQVSRPEIGCVGAKLYYSNDQIQHAGVIVGVGHVAGHAHRFLDKDNEGYQGRLKQVQNYSAVTAACLLVRKSVFEEVGGLDEVNLTVAYNDVDFCLRVVKAGYRNLWTPYAELYHHESISRGEDNTPAKKARYDKEVAYMHENWRKLLDHDPCYNPNLSRKQEDFSLREFVI